MDRQYLFVDGGYLRGVLAKIAIDVFDTAALEIDPRSLTERFDKAFFYDCLPVVDDRAPQEPDPAIDAAKALFRKLRRTSGVHVVEGRLTGAGRRRQKMIDVGIAVDMLSHSHRRNMERVTLLAGDLDFKPLVDALVLDGRFVTLWYEPTSASSELIEAADRQDVIDASTVYQICPSIASTFAEPDREVSGPQKRTKTPTAVGRSGDGARVGLWEGAGYWLIEFEMVDEDDKFLSISHADRKFLERFAANVVGEFEYTKETGAV